ncbi:MAG: IclR family transcriptional regulator [Kiloniellaceae bacterium]
MTKEGGILGRYAVVLEVLAASPDGLSLMEVMRATGLPRGTVHRLINALCGVGYIVRRDGRKIYVLGPRLLRLLHMGVAPTMVSALARPILGDLAARFKETAFVGKLLGTEVQSVAMVIPDSENQTYVQPGRVMPVHAAASAKVIMAFQDDSLVEEVLSQPRARFTDSTRVEEDEVRADLEQVRRQGFAVCDEELDPGVLSYACPVHLEGAGVLYSIGMVGLSQRLHSHAPNEIIAALRAAAEDFSNRLPSGLRSSTVAEVPALAAEQAKR